MSCHPDEILLYIEGELTPGDAARVRSHVAVCVSCRELLRTEQALECALGGLRDLQPPANFAAATVRRAECDVAHALRSPRERRRAAVISASLASLALLLLWPTGVLSSALETLAPARCMARFAFGWIENSAISAFIIGRTISRSLLYGTSIPAAGVFLLFGLLISLLVWLIVSYRTGAR